MLLGKLALITGAGSGIGKATCVALSRENARVVAVDVRKDLLERATDRLSGSGHSAFVMDVSSSKSISQTVREILNTYQLPPSIIVNCAGITRDNFITNMSDQEFQEVIDVNLKGTYLVLQLFAKLLIEHKMKGSIINIGSIIGKIGNMGQCNYSASKAGVESLTKTAAKEFGKQPEGSGKHILWLGNNIDYPNVAPRKWAAKSTNVKYYAGCIPDQPKGFIETPMVATVPEKVRALFAKQIALGRMGRAEEVAEVITFLASDKSSYVNGASIEVTGGGL